MPKDRMPRGQRLAVIAAVVWAAPVAADQPFTLLNADSFAGTRASLVAPSGGAGLFDGRDGRGAFFTDGQGWIAAPRLSLPGVRGDAAAQLRDLIAEAEAGPAGYDAVQHMATIKPPKAPSRMTIGEIYAWIDATPGQHHAIGRYQFIPPTLRRLVDALDLPDSTQFSPKVQDRLADLLLLEAGIVDFTAGRMARERFKRNLARIWAGLPLSSGRSYYDGYAGNKATMSWAAFDAAMREIFPG